MVPRQPREHVRSAGILLYRQHDGKLEVLLVHLGGPYWSHRDHGAWSIPKGLIERNEDPLSAAQREFREETGFGATGAFLPLGEVTLPSGKIIHAWALEGDLDPSRIVSNSFSLEWPPHSGTLHIFPEIDRGAWFTLEVSWEKISPGQRALLKRLAAKLRG